MRSWLGVLACLTVGCTQSNPDFRPPGETSPDLGSPATAFDLAVSGARPDLATGGGAPDLATVAMCTAGERRCVTSPSPTSEGCFNGAFGRSRTCPFGTKSMMGAVCQSGYCQPPTTNGTTSCGTGGPLEQICSAPGNGSAAYSCQPFIADPTTKSVEWWCAVAAQMGAGVAGSSCSKGSDCRTGFCGSNGTCFWACQNTGDCLSATLQCSPVTIRVEGVTVDASSCIP